jgi:protein required for attachment to host cells
MHLDPTWIVVADSQAARFFLRSQWGEPLKEIVDLAASADFLNRLPSGSTDITLGYPSGAKSDVETRERDKIESDFLHRVASGVDKAMSEHAAQGLVLCAPARELCLLRDYISASSRAKLSCEITADLVNAKKSAIEAEMNLIKA